LEQGTDMGPSLGLRTALLALALAPFLALAGCASQQRLVTQMYRERFNCASFTVRELRAGHWTAEGCGHLRNYDCKTEESIFASKAFCKENAPDLSKPAPIALVEQMHRTEYGCKAVSVWPVDDGVQGIYEARGCGPTTLYRCTGNGTAVFCKPYQPEPPAANGTRSGH
jgi:hypothetical protein